MVHSARNHQHKTDPSPVNQQNRKSGQIHHLISMTFSFRFFFLDFFPRIFFAKKFPRSLVDEFFFSAPTSKKSRCFLWPHQKFLRNTTVSKTHAPLFFGSCRENCSLLRDCWLEDFWINFLEGFYAVPHLRLNISDDVHDVHPPGIFWSPTKTGGQKKIIPF